MFCAAQSASCFLATPFGGSDASREARWARRRERHHGRTNIGPPRQGLDSSDAELQKLRQSFAELARRPSIELPICCFYETKKTELLRRLLAT